MSIDEEAYKTETNCLDIFLLTTEPKTYEISVTAHCDSVVSDFSERLEYTVNEPPSSAFEMKYINKQYSLKVKNKSELTGKVVVPSEVDGIPVLSIGFSAFSGCKSMTGVILAETVEEVNVDAFTDCESLERIEFPLWVERIGSKLFSGCPNLKSISVDEMNPTYRSEGNCIIRKADGALIAGCNGSVIPQGVTSIERSAFLGCSALKELRIPQGVTAIEDLAFWGCSALKELKIPASVTRIEQRAFADCYALEELELSDGLKELNGSSIFQACKSLKSLNIPRTVEKIDRTSNGLFGGTELLSLTVNEENPYFYSEGNCIIRKSDGVLVVGCSSSVIPDYVEEIGIGAFSGCSLTQIFLPAGLKTIGFGAFAGCPLTHVYIPESVETIESRAFDGRGLQSVILPGSVKTIGAFAFGEGSNIYTSVERSNKGWESGDPYYVWCYGSFVRECAEGRGRVVLRTFLYV